MRGKATTMNLDDPEAARLLDQAIALAEESLGPDHLITARNLERRAFAHEVMGEFDAARRLRERVLAIQETQLGPQHPQTAETRWKLKQMGTWVSGYSGVSYPKLIKRFLPRYPTQARQRRIMGAVILAAIIKKDGSVGSILVLRAPASGLGFEAAALEALQRWRYEPATRNGEPVEVSLTIVIEFDLR